MLKFLPLEISSALARLKEDGIYEVRLRADRPVAIDYYGKHCFLSANGITERAESAMKISYDKLGKLTFELCERSVYSYADRLLNGFITLKGGVRVGVCGECVTDGGVVAGVKNITSLNIRVPHAVPGCSERIFSEYHSRPLSTIIISPPGRGKTTMARDLAEKISSEFLLSVLVVDERGELFPLMSKGFTVDCMLYAKKDYAFENGIRSMSPDVIVTDELVGEADAKAVVNAARSGIVVIATAHGNNIEEFFRSREYAEMNEAFELKVLLGENKGEIAEMVRGEA